MKDPLRSIVWDLYRAASRRTSRGEAAYRRNHVSWLVAKDGWFSVRKCSVLQYAPGCIRFRNDLDFDIPKRVWPFRALPRNTGTMEITVHESEVAILLPLLVQIAEDPTHDYPSDLFPNGLITMANSWSNKAWRHQEAMRSLKKKRPS